MRKSIALTCLLSLLAAQAFADAPAGKTWPLSGRWRTSLQKSNTAAPSCLTISSTDKSTLSSFFVFGINLAQSGFALQLTMPNDVKDDSKTVTVIVDGKHVIDDLPITGTVKASRSHSVIAAMSNEQAAGLFKSMASGHSLTTISGTAHDISLTGAPQALRDLTACRSEAGLNSATPRH